MDPIEMMRNIAAEAYTESMDNDPGSIITFQTVTMDDPAHAALITRDGGVGTRVFLDVSQTVAASLETMVEEIEETYGSLAEATPEAKIYYSGYRDCIMALMTGGMAIQLAYDTQNLSPTDFS